MILSTPGTEPTPLVEPDQLDTVSLIGFELVLGLALLFLIVGLLVFALLRSARLEPRGMVVVAVSVLTVVALGGALVTGSDSIAQLAAVGLGALAGAVSELFTAHRDGPDTPSDPGRA